MFLLERRGKLRKGGTTDNGTIISETTINTTIFKIIIVIHLWDVISIIFLIAMPIWDVISVIIVIIVMVVLHVLDVRWRNRKRLTLRSGRGRQKKLRARHLMTD